ncbi:apoptosis regulatory protein Siva-like isoform X2 [Xyrauchen texanus]|uniref:apoptosis regulatory protein Siva-like isoform X2 n=1 Tax=Xyrauchen texanus TaxID=154827 RepID=UPI0022424311|nr:apoptosis regulatory protein Siva-like isoform X2 [Xyrauchen texanus]
MPKRSYPFSETFSSQYKVHVGQKEMSNYGVFGLKYKQEIYEKTKNLLFNGTKTVMSRIWNVDGDEPVSGVKVSDHTTASSVSGHQTLLKGQTLIGSDGRLKKRNAVSGSSAAPTACCVCQRVSGSRQPCSQCERHACTACTQQCNSCFNHCCSLCTVTELAAALMITQHKYFTGIVWQDVYERKMWSLWSRCCLQLAVV